ncbi:MAG: alpha/beta hydrolase-fold protein [Steroidobacteraceae bacterium]
MRQGLIAALVALLLGLFGPAALAAPRFNVTYPATASSEPLAGRLLLILAPGGKEEPRAQVAWDDTAIPFFGVDIEGWKPGRRQVVGRGAAGFPLRSLDELPAGEYRVQAVLNRYDKFTLADGRSLLLPPDRGEGQVWRLKPGNLYSKPVNVRIDPKRRNRVDLVLDQVIPPVAAFESKQTDYVRYLKMRSERLSKFWGRDIFLAAWVRLPWGFHEHPEARYPLVIAHGHFPAAQDGFRETPPDPGLAPEYSKRFRLEGYNRIQQEYAWQAHRDWITAGFPRVLLVEIQHPTPYYDDSYAVNSANNGPYGDAIQYELIPVIEKQFRALGTGWSRFVYGGSTGGWEAMAVQIFYPDDYNGAWIACPDPIDFRHYVQVDIYADTNAYYAGGAFKRTARPAHRDWLGRVNATIEEQNRYEATLGTHGRSGDQWDAWESVFSPVGPDGYPRRIWDRQTGEIDPVTAAYWREHYDLGHILRRDWATLGPKLRGKLRIYTGDMDNYYLNNAVYAVEGFLKSADPPAEAVVEYGDRAEHCWNGDHTRANAYSRLRYPQMVLPWVVERILDTAPEGADVDSWRY